MACEGLLWDKRISRVDRENREDMMGLAVEIGR